MNESNAFAAGVVAYQSRLRAKLVLIERACGTVGSERIAALDIRGRLVRFKGLCQRNEREAAEKVLDDIIGDLTWATGSTPGSDRVDATHGDHVPIVKKRRHSKTRKSGLQKAR